MKTNVKTSQSQKKALFYGEEEEGFFYFGEKVRNTTIRSLIRLGMVEAIYGPTHGQTETEWTYHQWGRVVIPKSFTVVDISYRLTPKGKDLKSRIRRKKG